LVAAILTAGGFAAYARIGTTANVERVITYERLVGGFAAVGITDAQPGFLLLSLAAQRDVTIESEFRRSIVAGTTTRLMLQTPNDARTERLRGPRLYLIDADGRITAAAAPWSHSDLQAIANVLGCEKTDDNLGRCGAPFVDLAVFLERWPKHAVPPELANFLAEVHARSKARAHQLIPA
jgi:hypothetical protein